MAATAIAEVPIVEAEKVRHVYADGWIEKTEGGICVMRLYRNHGPADDPERIVFQEIHLPAFAYDAIVQSTGQTCVRALTCERRVKPLGV